jgi:hypothetical protein
MLTNHIRRTGAKGVGPDDDDGGVVRCAFADIQEAHKRRYLFRDTALELFSNDGRDHLLVFATQVCVYLSFSMLLLSTTRTA